MKILLKRSSLSGRCLFFVTVLIAFSGDIDFRIPIAGAFVHPYLLAFAPLLFVIITQRAHRLATPFYVGSGLFITLAVISMLRFGFELGELLKLMTTFVAIGLCALAIRNKYDAYLGFVGVCIGVFIFTLLGSIGNDASLAGMMFTKGLGNKNTYSLYAIPAFLLGLSYFSFSKQNVSLQSVLVVCFLATILWAVLVSGNRSGWIGVLLVFALLFTGRRQKLRLFAIAALVGASVYIFAAESTSKILAHKREVTLKTYDGDTARWEILKAGIKTIAENPILGLSPRGFSFALGKGVTGYGNMRLDPHNVYLFLLGAFGIPATVVFLFICGSMIMGRPEIVAQSSALTFTKCLTFLMLLWLLRGLFSREILSAPAFLLSLGIAWGGSMCEQRGIDHSRRLTYLYHLFRTRRYLNRSKGRPARVQTALIEEASV